MPQVGLRGIVILGALAALIIGGTGIASASSSGNFINHCVHSAERGHLGLASCNPGPGMTP
jgi:hypothetical protein